MYRLTTTLKKVLGDKVNRLTLLLIANIILTLYIYIEGCNERYHYYRNITTTLEEISGKSFDVYNGEVKQQKSTEEKLIRKQNQKFHLKYLFK